MTEANAVETLFRPVGQQELDLIAAGGWRAFPPRLPFQPIFYPVLHEAYAVQIARDWNTRDAASGAEYRPDVSRGRSCRMPVPVQLSAKAANVGENDVKPSESTRSLFRARSNTAPPW